MFEAANDPVYEKRGVAATRGHCAGNGGLRGHSVGRTFPCIIFLKGKPDSLSYWFKSPDNQEHGPYSGYSHAEAAAETWLEYHRPVSFEPQTGV